MNFKILTKEGEQQGDKMTIQERALQVCDLKEVPDKEERYYNRLNCEKYDALIKFGKEQQEIDIERAVEWLLENMDTYLQGEGNINQSAESRIYETHYQFISRFEQAMKGE